jgi:capsular polysaccharide export protein
MNVFVPPVIKSKTDILLLQGPVGTFFDDIHAEFTKRGVKTMRIAFDRADETGETLRYRGSFANWERFLKELLMHETPHTLVLFGDSRPHHKIACAIARDFGVRIFALEEGYIRPGFITLEEEGNNANSPLIHAVLADFYPVKPFKSLVSPPRFCKYKAAVRRYMVNAMMPSIESQVSLLHRPRKILSEMVNWANNAYLFLKNRHIDQKTIHNLRKSRYFVVALQVHDDAQILSHGRGFCNDRLISEAIASFKVHAPANTRLVFKIHPLDRGHRPYARLIRQQANARVDILHTGVLGMVVRHSLGLITINSTGGLVALNHGKPVIALGACFYNRPGLTFEGSLDDFWHNPPAPDKELWQGLRSQIIAQSLTRGCFYDPARRIETVKNTVARILKQP